MSRHPPNPETKLNPAVRLTETSQSSGSRAPRVKNLHPPPTPPALRAPIAARIIVILRFRVLGFRAVRAPIALRIMVILRFRRPHSDNPGEACGTRADKQHYISGFGLRVYVWMYVCMIYIYIYPRRLQVIYPATRRPRLRLRHAET